MNITVSEARERLAELIGRVQYGNERVVMEKHGRPVAVLVPVSDALALEDMDEQDSPADGNDQAAADAEEMSFDQVLRQVAARMG